MSSPQLWPAWHVIARCTKHQQRGERPAFHVLAVAWPPNAGNALCVQMQGLMLIGKPLSSVMSRQLVQ